MRIPVSPSARFDSHPPRPWLAEADQARRVVEDKGRTKTDVTIQIMLVRVI